MKGRASAHRYLLSAAARLSPPDVDPQRNHGVGGARYAVVTMNAVGPRRQRWNSHQHAPKRLSKAHNSLYRTQPCAEGTAGDTETVSAVTQPAAAPGRALGDPGWGGGAGVLNPAFCVVALFPRAVASLQRTHPKGLSLASPQAGKEPLGSCGAPHPLTQGAAAYQRWFPFAPFSTTMRRSIMLRTKNVESTRSGS